MLLITEQALNIAQASVDHGLVPSKASEDALHSATATVHGVDHLLTWNCLHVANPAMQRDIAEHLSRQACCCRIFAHRQTFLEKTMLNDEIVDEVRAIRDAHAAGFGYDLRAIYVDLKQSEAERIAAGRPFVSPPVELPAPNSALQRTRFAHR